MFKVLHITNSSLAGAPWQLSAALKRFHNIESHVIFSRSPTAGVASFADEFIYFDSNEFRLKKYYKTFLSSFDIIHIHNTISHSMLSLLSESDFNGKFVYQCHSPLKERPLYIDVTKEIKIPFSKKLIIGHHHPRHFSDYEMVPNIVMLKPAERIRPYVPGSQLKVIHSPSHSQTFWRWNSKSSNTFLNGLTRLQANNLVDIHSISGMPYRLLWEVRKGMDITIDEVVTGSYHLVSYEGLANGNIVINGADDLSLLYLKSMLNANCPPPFIRANDINFVDKITALLADYKKINKLKRDSLDYFNEFMLPERLSRIFVEKYDEIL